MNVQRVQQPTPWSCFAAVAVMITGEEFEDFYQHVGHDGSKRVAGGLYEDGIQGFGLGEIIGYLASRGFVLGVAARREHFPGTCADRRQLLVPVFLNQPAVLIVSGGQWNHAVFWTGEKVLDPSSARPGLRELGEYRVLEWWPVARIV